MPWCVYCPPKSDGAHVSFDNDGELFAHFIANHDKTATPGAITPGAVAIFTHVDCGGQCHRNVNNRLLQCFDCDAIMEEPE